MLTKKEKNIAQPAITSTQKPKPEEVVPEKLVLFDLSEFSKEKIEQAEALGIPIRKIADTMNTYAETIETRFAILAKAIPTQEDISGAMTKAINNAQQKSREAYAEAIRTGKIQPQGQGGGGWGEFLKLLQGGGGGGMDEDMKARYNKMMDLQFNRLEADVSFSRTMENYVKSQFAAKMGKKLTEGLE